MRSSLEWHEGEHDPFPWMTYFWGVMLKAYAESEERVGEITTSRGSKTQHVREAVSRQVGPFAISEIESACPVVSRVMIRHVPNQLRDEGRLEVRGRGRGAKWLAV